MSALVGIRGQIYNDHLYDASGTVAMASTAQLVLPRVEVRSSLILENISSVNMYFEIGGPRATATLTSGTVTSCAVTNAGFGYSRPPIITFLGGALRNRAASPTYTLTGTPDMIAPSHPATAHCVMTGAAGSMSVSSIVIDDPGAGYAYPPYVKITNDSLDPFGCAVPSATSGLLLLANGGSYTANGSVCTTDPIAIFSTSTLGFTCKFSL